MIAELKRERMIGYACICSTKVDKEKLQDSKAYLGIEKQIEESTARFKKAFLNPECILIDVISGPTRKRNKLEEIIDTFKHGDNWYQSPKGTLVIESLSALGTRPDIVSKNFMRLVIEDIGVLILKPDQDSFSTADFGGEYRVQDPLKREKIAEEAGKVEIKTKRGTKKGDITEDFKTVYWLYENYFIPESLVYYNTINGKTTHVTFTSRCADYERSPEYVVDEAAEHAKNRIGDKPKRYGKPPEGFEKLCSLIVSGEMSLEDASKELGITPTTFNRYILKGAGRKAMSQATYTFKDQAIVDAITPKE